MLTGHLDFFFYEVALQVFGLFFSLCSLPLTECIDFPHPVPPFSEAKTLNFSGFLFWHLYIILILNSMYILLLFIHQF